MTVSIQDVQKVLGEFCREMNMSNLDALALLGVATCFHDDIFAKRKINPTIIMDRATFVKNFARALDKQAQITKEMILQKGTTTAPPWANDDPNW